MYFPQLLALRDVAETGVLSYIAAIAPRPDLFQNTTD